MSIPGKREEIMQASLDLIAEHGFHQAPMAEIADKAGVAAGTIYRYFESKDELINELHKALEEDILAFIQCSYPSTRPVRERFLYISRRLLRYFMENPIRFRYMEQYFNSPYGISLRKVRLMGKQSGNDLLSDLFRQGIDQQIIKDLPVAVLFSLAFGPMILLIRDHILAFCILDDALITKVTEACWDTVKR